MEILDQLRAEADQKKFSDQQEIGQKQQADRLYTTQVLPKMQQVFAYLQELVEHLNYLEVPIQVDNYSARYPDLGTLEQKTYKISTDGFGGFSDLNKLMQINMTFVCEGEGEFQYTLQTKAVIDQEIAFLHAKRLAVKINGDSDTGIDNMATIVVARKIPVRVRFEVDYEQSLIKVMINNYMDFSVYSELLHPDVINNEFLDKLARYLLRKDADFIKLEMSDESRDELCKKIEIIKLEEELEQEGKLRVQERLLEQKKKQKLSYKVKSFIFEKIKS